MTRRHIALPAFVASLLVAAACSSTNGAPIPSETLDASPLDAGTNPQPYGDAGPDGDGDGDEDSGGGKDAGKDAPSDAPPDGPTVSSVRINELYVGGVVGGDINEYVELRGDPGAPLGDLELRLIKSDGTVSGEVDVFENPSDVMPANGFWVVGGSLLIDNIDRKAPISAWGLDEDLGAVQLVRVSGVTHELLDVVGYSTAPDAGGPPAPPSPPTSTFEKEPALQPPIDATKKAFGRAAGAADTNDNFKDFCTQAQSPGVANGPCL
jgi:hypothetical protein